MKRYLIAVLIIAASKSVFAQDSCYLSGTLISNKLEINCSGKKTSLNAETNITINKYSIAVEVNIMGLLKHSYFIITKLDSCKKTEAGFEYVYEIEESSQGDADLTSGKSILKISKSKELYNFDILGLKKDDCSTKFFVTSYKKTE